MELSNVWNVLAEAVGIQLEKKPKGAARAAKRAGMPAGGASQADEPEDDAPFSAAFDAFNPRRQNAVATDPRQKGPAPTRGAMMTNPSTPASAMAAPVKRTNPLKPPPERTVSPTGPKFAPSFSGQAARTQGNVQPWNASWQVKGPQGPEWRRRSGESQRTATDNVAGLVTDPTTGKEELRWFSPGVYQQLVKAGEIKAKPGGPAERPPSAASSAMTFVFPNQNDPKGPGIERKFPSYDGAAKAIARDMGLENPSQQDLQSIATSLQGSGYGDYRLKK